MNKHKLNIHWGNKIANLHVVLCIASGPLHVIVHILYVTQFKHLLQTENNISNTTNTVHNDQYQVCTLQTQFYIQQTPKYCTVDKQE